VSGVPKFPLRTPEDALLILSALLTVQPGPELMRAYTEAIRLWFDCWQACDPASRAAVVKMDNDQLDRLMASIIQAGRYNDRVTKDPDGDSLNAAQRIGEIQASTPDQ